MTAGNNSAGGSHPGMMGDGTEEQNLNQPGNPDARITEKEVEEAFKQGGGKGGAQGGAAQGGTGGAGKVDDQVSNDVSDAKATPQDNQPKDNSHNFS